MGLRESRDEKGPSILKVHFLAKRQFGSNDGTLSRLGIFVFKNHSKDTFHVVAK